jgi:hypothetical protein
LQPPPPPKYAPAALLAGIMKSALLDENVFDIRVQSGTTGVPNLAAAPLVLYPVLTIVQTKSRRCSSNSDCKSRQFCNHNNNCIEFPEKRRISDYECIRLKDCPLAASRCTGGRCRE